MVVLLAAGMLVGVGTSPAQAVTRAYSGIWSGVLSTGGGYSSVTAEVNIPRVTALCGGGSNVAVFIGLGAWTRLPFVQAGFVVTPKGIGFWSELFDKTGRGPVTTIALPARPGDRIRLSLGFSPNRSVLTFRWENLTRHLVRTQRVTNAGRYYNGSNADYIVERSYYPYRGSPLARYSAITFRNAKAVRYGHWVPAYNSRSTLITMLGARGGATSRVTWASGTSFGTGWSGCR